jgi:hypothetical protein
LLGRRRLHVTGIKAGAGGATALSYTDRNGLWRHRSAGVAEGAVSLIIYILVLLQVSLIVLATGVLRRTPVDTEDKASADVQLIRFAARLLIALAAFSLVPGLFFVWLGEFSSAILVLISNVVFLVAAIIALLSTRFLSTQSTRRG